MTKLKISVIFTEDSDDKTSEWIDINPSGKSGQNIRKTVKTATWSVILQLLLALFAQADIKVTSVEQPPSGQIVERSIVTMLRFKITGAGSTLKRVVVHRDGTDGNGMYGEYILVSEEDGLVRAKTTVDTDGFVRFNLGARYTAEKSSTYAVRLRALPVLRPYGGNDVSLRLSSLEVEGGSLIGDLPIVGPNFTINANPIIGNVLLYPERRQSTNELMVNVPGQELGRFRADVWQFEPVVANGFVFYVRFVSATRGAISDIYIEDENGSVVAGPVDSKPWGEDGTQVVRFDNTVTFMTGRSFYTIRGKLSSTGFNHNSVVGLLAATSEWKFTGATSGYELEAWSRDFSLEYTPVNTGLVFVVLDPNGGIVHAPAGSSLVQIGRLNLLTYGSAEDMRLTHLRLCVAGSARDSIRNLQVYSGSIALNTTSPVVYSNGVVDITLDSPLTVLKNTGVEIGIRADIDSEAQAGSVFHLSICDYTAEGFQFDGIITGTPPFVHIPIQLGVDVVIEDRSDFPRIGELNFFETKEGRLVNLSGAGMPNTDYSLEVSTDLENWEVVGGLKLGPYTVIKEPAVGLLPYGDRYSGQAFFRLKQKQ